MPLSPKSEDDPGLLELRAHLTQEEKLQCDSDKAQWKKKKKKKKFEA